MAYAFTGTEVGLQPIATTDTVQNHRLGTVARAFDSTYGEGEFIYLLGVANTLVGSLVIYNAKTGQTTLAPNTANKGQPVVVAMSANVASQYGWYQRKGTALIKKSSVACSPDVAIFLSAIAGRIMPTVASGKQIIGARVAEAASVSARVSQIAVTIDRPILQGQVI